MTIPNKLEETRIFSNLSEQIHYVDIDGCKYACFGGNIIPYSMIGAFLIWAWTNSKVYYSLYKDSDMVDAIKELNLHDDRIVQNPSAAPWYLSKKLRDLMKTWDEQHFENIFQQALV